MPSVFRFLVIVGTVFAAAYTGLYAVATYWEPEQREVTHPVYGVKIERK